MAYQTGSFDMSKQNDVLDFITRNDSGFTKSVRRNLLFTFTNYINELGFRLPAFDHYQAGQQVKVPVRKLSDVELKAEFEKIKKDIAALRVKGNNDIWQNKKHQRAVCKLLAIIREAMYRDGDKSAYSTQMDAIILAILAGEYQYAMQINTGEGKGLIAAAIEIALQTITDKQIIVTTSNLSLAGRDGGTYDRFIKWFGISHAIITATTKDKEQKLKAKIIHTTGNDFALCHGKDVAIDNSNKIYLNDEYDYTKSHLIPSINSQSKPNEDENWWIYEEILTYVETMTQHEARKKSTQQAGGLIDKLIQQYTDKIRELEQELTHKLHEIQMNEAGKSPQEQIADRDAAEKTIGGRIEFYEKRLRKLNASTTADQFDRLIDSAIIAQFVLRLGVGYEVIDQVEQGKILKKVVPTEGGKPITEGDVMYMYGIHQFLIEKTIRNYRTDGNNSEFIKPSELESSTYFNNYSTQAGSKSIGITGSVPKPKYKMYQALMDGGRSDVIPPHQKSIRKDSVSYEDLHKITVDNKEHVFDNENGLIDKLVGQIKDHGENGPALIYCSDKNSCYERQEKLIEKLRNDGYTVQVIIPGVTEDFTDGEKLTAMGRQAHNKKTVTLTVGDGRGIDITANLLTICSFAPETIEKLLQILGRSGRDGKDGKTNILILKEELTKFGIPFANLDELYTFLDVVRHREFDFAIKKIGFMQYEVQSQIEDEKKKTTMIAYMDDLYNRLMLKAVAKKVKTKGVRGENSVGGKKFSGRWEPFIILDDKELENIYTEFRRSVDDQLLSEGLYHIKVERINNLQRVYRQKVDQAVIQEQEAQKGLSATAITEQLNQHAEKQHSKLYDCEGTVELADGTEVDIADPTVRSLYIQFAANASRFDKTAELMQRHVGSHLGIYGFIQDNISVPYMQIHKLLEQQKQVLKGHQQQETDRFYSFLAYTETSKALYLLISDINSGTKLHEEAIAKHFQYAERYNGMVNGGVVVDIHGGYQIAEIRGRVLHHYGINPERVDWSQDDLEELRTGLNTHAENTRVEIEGRKDGITQHCIETCRAFQNKVFIQGAAPLTTLTARPMRDNDARLAFLFSMLQLVTKEERQTEPVKRLVAEISKEVKNELVTEFNNKVIQYKDILKKERDCLEYLREPNDTKEKVSKYAEMVNFDEVSSKNLVAFYHDYVNLPDRLASLGKDIEQELPRLAKLEAEVAARRSREQYFRQIRNRIITAMDTLRVRVEGIEHHPLQAAINVAIDLLADLETQQKTYLPQLQMALSKLDVNARDFHKIPEIMEVNDAYIKACDDLINAPATRRVLERDLNWGPYLTNLLKWIVNAVIWVASFSLAGSSFFALQKSETQLAIDEQHDNLLPHVVGAPG